MEDRNKYLYADKNEQLRSANKLLVIGYIIFYLFVLAIVVISYFRGIRSSGYTAAMASIVLLVISLTVIMFNKNKYDSRIKYIASSGLMIVTFLVAFAFDNYYMRFMAVIPFTLNVLSYDKKFFARFGMINSAINIIVTFLKTSILNEYTGEAIIDNWCATLAIVMFMVFLYVTVDVGRRFNEDAIGRLEEEKASQKKMLDDIVSVAEEVRRGTENAMSIVTELNDSTDVVNRSVRDISESTQSTAEDIQNQTIMTNSIQDAITDTLQRSENMVLVANESDKLNSQNLELIHEIKQQSTMISDINSDVSKSMDKLQERTNKVKSIADVIYSISSQTNLLALNASIESARAGEAGKGFAVVAEEIRKLAEETREETESIGVILEELSQEAEEVAEAVNNSVSATQTQDASVNKASESFECMDKNFRKLITDIGGIDKMLNNLSEANNQIVENIMHLSATTEEVTAASEQSAEMSDKNLVKAENTKKVLNQVLEVSYQIDKYLTEESL
ncbi:MAG TPA: hypothetical protein H9946_11945 [Candidatus Jeotgalibaca pullicola]|nr:hypothetical protein [Candidatus Jeotgalibaca pullicola]